MNFLILLCHYKRYNMVRNALSSLVDQTYKNFMVALVDDTDNSLMPDLLTEYPTLNVELYVTGDSDEVKQQRGYSRFGAFWNKAIQTIDSDVAIMLCDDDALHPDYLQNLKDWYEKNQNCFYCYSHVLEFNPLEEDYRGASRGSWLNHTHPLLPSCVVDASQVSWRSKAFNELGMAFSETQTVNLDASVYDQMGRNWGLCPFSGFVGQYKGTFSNQLSFRSPNTPVIDKP